MSQAPTSTTGTTGTGVPNYTATDPTVISLASTLGIPAADVAAALNGGSQTVTGGSIIDELLKAVQQPISNALTARGQDIGLSEAEAQAQQATNQALIQYYSDTAQIGQAAATANYQQRLGQVQQGLQLAQQAASERQNYVGDAMQGLQLLASRQGPQDWVAYNNLLNGLSAPTPGTSQSVNVLNLASNALNPALQQAANNVPYSQWLNNLYQPYTPPSPGSIQMPAGFTTPQFTGVPADIYQAPTAATNPGGPMNTTAGGGAPALGQPASTKSYTDSTGQTVNVQSPMIPAGSTPAGADYVGIPNSQVSGLQSGQGEFVTTGEAGPFGTSTLSPGLSLNYSGNSYTNTSPNAQIPGGTPVWIEKLSHGTKNGMIHDLISIVGEGKGQKPGKSKAQKTLGDTGEMVYNPTGAPIGVLNNSQSKQVLQQGALTGRGNGRTRYARGSGMQQPVTRPRVSARQSVSKGSLRSPVLPQFAQPQQQQGQQQQQPDVAAMLGGMGPLHYANGSGMKVNRYDDGSGLFNNQGQYGMPQNLVYNTYSPSQMGSQPFWSKLTGTGQVPAFQGFGAPLGNSNIGISNAPSLFNLQNYIGEDPSEQQQVQSVYSQGLGVNWDDMLANAQRSAPIGASFGPTSYGA